ncbi:hypothetical protein N9A94_09515 [Akkermansiaceae bacterium]|nr:hypothetical protein [Akkermansiaceae bacterium]MDA7887851.1 hypothetical protein [Akkermansiaceae bacterium]MDB4544499.1 hypothetical protein [Akkermansiaceae bacterium]
MRRTILPTLIALGLLSSAKAEPAKEGKPDANAKAEALKEHQDKSVDLADKQDSLSADVQELIDEQTNPIVIKLLSTVEMLMAETTERLEDQDTGGETIAVETEIVEKIYEAAKKKAQSSPQQGDQQSMGAMLQMMQEMMGKGEKPGDKPGEGQTGGEGQEGDSDSANQANKGASSGAKSERRVPKAAGTPGASLPPEFQKALDAYNKTKK